MYPSRRRRGSSAKHPARKSNYRRTTQKDWGQSVDKALEVFVCFGHIVAAVTLIVEHLL